MAKARSELLIEIEHITERLSAHIDELDEFRAYLIQNPLDGSEPNAPMKSEILATMPPELRDGLPRELLETIALRSFAKKARKRTRRRA